MKKVSIIIPNYNTERWLPKCIESCIQQKGNFKKEIIVVDDQSTDSSWELLKAWKAKYPAEILILKNEIKGGNNARNLGFSYATGDYIQWLDSDDLILEGKLKAQVEFLERNKDVDIVYSDWKMDFYEGGCKERDELRVEKEYPSYIMHLLSNGWQPMLSYLTRKEIADKVDKDRGWNPDTRIGQDREYFTLAAIHGAKFAYCKGVFSIYNRWSSKSVSKRLSYLESSKSSLVLNQRFYKAIQCSEDLKDKGSLLGILNADLLLSLFYHPSLWLPRSIFPWRINWSYFHWKVVPLVPLLYIYHLFKVRVQ